MVQKKNGLIQLPGFAGVEEGGGSFHIPEGDYLMKCTGCTPQIAKSSGNEMLGFTFIGIEGKSKGRKFWLYCVLIPEALWKLRQTLTALGIDTPDDPSGFDPADVIGVEVVGTVVDNEYEGRTNSKVNAISAAEGTSAEAPSPPSKTAPAAAAKKGNGGKLERLASSQVEAMSENELEDIVAKYDLDIDLSNHKTPRRKANAVIAALTAERMLEG